MSKYETGICVHCGKHEDKHYLGGFQQLLCPNGKGNDFKDSGLAKLEANAVRLAEAVQNMLDSLMYSDDSFKKAISSLRSALDSCKVTKEKEG